LFRYLGTPIIVELNFSMEPQWPKKGLLHL
jgi:hypothetical protein